MGWHFTQDGRPADRKAAVTNQLNMANSFIKNNDYQRKAKGASAAVSPASTQPGADAT